MVVLDYNHQYQVLLHTMRVVVAVAVIQHLVLEVWVVEVQHQH
jgi:hypothetical protein